MSKIVYMMCILNHKWNGIELQNPVPENEYEKSELEANKERFIDYLLGMIKKYAQSSEQGLVKKSNEVIEKS